MTIQPEITIRVDRGPQLIYTSYDQADDNKLTRVPVDRVPVDDPRERALCRALLLHALTLLDASEPTRTTGSAR
ncbi:hypothetical protein OG393_30865 [Streptomyces sp. NBC_01216]|uniref:hypothetical protein n=1 Tax=Streptomyces sp. NBC_01216 TaxID=2903778 RepID=UPI002E166D83|nr:hypothetical protein OG393_30865 [Streptomyces sp. NBC_01216]